MLKWGARKVSDGVENTEGGLDRFQIPPPMFSQSDYMLWQAMSQAEEEESLQL